MTASRRAMGAYQPRTRKAAFADAMADARHKLSRALGIALLRGAGAVLFLSAAAMIGIGTWGPA